MTDRQINEIIEAYMRTSEFGKLKDELSRSLEDMPKEYTTNQDLLDPVMDKVTMEGLQAKVMAEFLKITESSMARRLALAIARVVKRER